MTPDGWCTGEDASGDPTNAELDGWEDVFGPWPADADAPPLGLLLYGRAS